MTVPPADPSAAETVDALFVYGTLMSGECAHARLEAGGSRRSLGRCSVAGRLYTFGDWPGLVRADEPGARVFGELYRFERIDELFALLDPYEDCPGPTGASGLFRRALVDVDGPIASPRKAWTYYYAGSLAAGTLLSSGDWRARFSK